MDSIAKQNLEKVRTINEVPGFNAECYALPYTDINTGETRKRLPFMPLLAWFRLRYPEGKIACSVVRENDCFIGTAKIYCSYKDEPHQYISEASVSRAYCDDKPSVSPREWAQTAAVAKALRNAGFGLQFDMVSDEYSETAPIERDTAADIGKTDDDISDNMTTEYVTSAVEEPVLPRIPKFGQTDEEKFEDACKVQCPIRKYSDKTLGDLITLDPKAIKWIAEKFDGNSETKAAALFICEYAASQAV